MSRGHSGSRPPSEEERLSGTLLGGLQNLANALGGLSTAFVLVGIIGLVLGVIILIFIPDLRPYSYIIMSAGGALLLVSVAMSFRTVSRAITGRRGRYGTNTAIMVAAFFGIAVVVSFLAFDNNKRFDVTATKQFSLAPRTVDLLKNLKEPVRVKAFFGPPTSPGEEAFQNQIDDLLHEFKVRTGKFSYEFIDPDIDPLTAREYEVTRYGTIVFESMESEKRHPVFPSAALEQEFVTGLLIITGQKQKQVYFLTGHGEADSRNREPDTEGYGIAYAGIANENYAVSTILLNSTERQRGIARNQGPRGIGDLPGDGGPAGQTGEHASGGGAQERPAGGRVPNSRRLPEKRWQPTYAPGTWYPADFQGLSSAVGHSRVQGPHCG